MGDAFEVFDLVTIGVTLVTLVATERVLRRTMFGIALRAAAEDFDAARIMGVRSNLAIRGAFALSGVLAGVAGVFWLMRTGTASPTVGLTPLLFGVIAAIVGGLAAGGATGGLLGLIQVFLRSWLPSDVAGLTEGSLLVLDNAVHRQAPGFVTVRRVERGCVESRSSGQRYPRPSRSRCSHPGC